MPDAPSALDLQPGSDTGSSNADSITSDTTPTFSGTAPADTLVQLYAGANVVGSITSDVTTGAWTITSSALNAGTYVFTAKSVGLYGSSAASPGLSVTIYTALTVTINQAGAPGRPDRDVSRSTSPSSSARRSADFATGDVTFTGTAGGSKTGTVTGSGTTYNVAVTGMTTAGSIIATVGAGTAMTPPATPNAASTSTDHTVAWRDGRP